MTETPELDPYTANVTFAYVKHEGLDEDYCVGRRYYWYDPERQGVWAWDNELRDQYPGIPEATWGNLFAAAFHRGEFEFLKSISVEELRSGAGSHFIGYQFGPRGAAEVARHDPEFQDFLHSRGLADDS